MYKVWAWKTTKLLTETKKFGGARAQVVYASGRMKLER